MIKIYYNTYTDEEKVFETVEEAAKEMEFDVITEERLSWNGMYMKCAGGEWYALDDRHWNGEYYEAYHSLDKNGLDLELEQEYKAYPVFEGRDYDEEEGVFFTSILVGMVFVPY